MDNVHDEVISHYGDADLTAKLLDAVRAAGHDLEALDAEALAGVDEFHLGGRATTLAVADRLDVDAEAVVLDVGCGIGGPARTVAGVTGCHVTGVDLTSDFVDAANELSGLVGLADRTTFEVADATDLRFDDGHFDAAMMIHAGMNIEDKSALVSEIARVLRPDGTLVIYDVMRVGEGDVDFPMPWASTPSSSFLGAVDEYTVAFAAAGLLVDAVTDRREMVLDIIERVAASPPPVNLRNLMGHDWPTMFGNLVAALHDGALAPMELVATRPEHG